MKINLLKVLMMKHNINSKKFEYPNELQIIFKKLNTHNLKAIIVGGYVRDFFLAKVSKDIDVEVYGLSKLDALVEIVQEFGKVDLVGKSFGVCKLHYKGLDVDFSMPRLENKTSTGHRGFVITTKKELEFIKASSRRDFTINAMGYDTLNKKILDPFGGLQDLHKKILRIVDKKSFIEDPLRVLRAMSMVARFDLEVHNYTLLLCKSMVNKGMLKQLPKERIYEEFKKLFFKSKKPSQGLTFLKKIDGLSFFNELNYEKNIWTETLLYLDNYATNNFNNTNIVIFFSILCYKMDEKVRKIFLGKMTTKKSILKEINLFCKIALYLDKKTTLLKYNEMRYIDLTKLYTFLQTINIDQKYIQKLDYLIPMVHAIDIIKEPIVVSKEIGDILQKNYTLQLKKYFI